jgi:hypothetical protein
VTRLRPGENRSGVWRYPAGDLDRIIIGAIAKALRRSVDEIGAECAIGNTLPNLSIPEQRRILLQHEVQVQLGSTHLRITLGRGDAQEVALPAQLGRRGTELRLLVPSDGEAARGADPVLLKLITHARLAQQAAITGVPDAIVSRYSKRHLWQLLRISWLAPDIIVAITDGRQPPTLTGRRLLRATDVPLDWNEQRRFFGLS